jgi:hypothetical protein
MEEQTKWERKIKNVAWFLVENVPSILTVAFTAWVLIQSQRSTLQVMEVLLWLLGIVGLLATSELVERFRHLQRIEDASFKILDAIQVKEGSDVENILKDRHDVKITPEMYKARKIWVCGYSLVNLVRVNENFFKERLQEGCHIRFLLLKPDCASTEVLDNLMLPYEVDLRNDIKTSLNRLRIINDSVRATAKGQMEVRLLKAMPTFSLLMVDHDFPNGWIFVELYPSSYHVSLDSGRPHFVLKKQKGTWYRFFYEQYEELWNNKAYSEPYTIGESRSGAKS